MTPIEYVYVEDLENGEIWCDDLGKWLKKVPITELVGDEAFLNWLDSAQASLEMEKGIRGKTERIRTRLSMLKEVRENYLRVNNKTK